MKLAWQQGADGLETDIHLSQDGRIVVMHDYDTKRVSGVSNKIVASTWDQLKGLDIGQWKSARWAGEKIPTLDSLLATVPEGKCILIEIKVHAEILPALEKTMTASGQKPAQMRIITFYLDTAQAAKKHFPKQQVYWLASYAKDKKSGQLPDIDDLIRKAKEAKLDGLDVDWKFPINAAFVQKVHAAGLQLHVWTVDDAEVATRLEAAGVDSITTNRPEFLRARLKK